MAQSHLSNGDDAHGSVGDYFAGFVLSVVLTAASFGLVLGGLLPPRIELVSLAALAFVQIVVHLIYFFHMDGSSSQRWNVLAFSFTVLIACIVIAGSLWIMHNVSLNMMSR
jgi:cytochrome o ubiquinol oxidase operon protein cyoD